MAFDDFFKNLLKEMYGSAVESGISIGSLEKRIDVVLHGDAPIVQQSNLLPFFKQHPIHILEFKSHRDNYAIKDLTKLLGYGAFFCENKGLGPEDMNAQVALWFITTLMNPELKDFLQHTIVRATEFRGIYQMDWSHLFYIVVINELDITEQTSLFLINSSGGKFSAYLRAITQKQISFPPRLHRYLRSKLLLDYRSVDNLTEVSEFFALDVKENIRAAVNDIGLEKVLEAVGIEKTIEALGIDKVIASVGIDKVIASMGIDKVLKSIGKKYSRQEILKKLDNEF